MNLFHRSCGRLVKALSLAVLFLGGAAFAQGVGSTGTSDLVASADRMLLRGDYGGAIPALKEVISRTSSLTDLPGRTTCQTCRFQLARSYYRTGDIPAGRAVLESYLDNEPRGQERLALRMMAQGFFDEQNWDKIENLALRLLALPDLEKEDIYNANLLLGQARFRLEKWEDSVKPLSYAARHAKEERVKGLCQIMVVRALVEEKDWRQLFGKLPGIYRTDSKYDISLNLTLMKAGRTLFDSASEVDNIDEQRNMYLNALLLYRWVLPREKLLAFSNKKLVKLQRQLDEDTQRGLPPVELEEQQTEIKDLRASMDTLKGLPPYEDEVTFRIGQIYAEVKRYWEAYVLFDKLYRADSSSEMGEAAMLQSVLILNDVGEEKRTEERILEYLETRPQGKYARTMLYMLVGNKLRDDKFNDVVGLRPYADNLPETDDPSEEALQANILYYLAFGYFQNFDYKGAGEVFSIIVDKFKDKDEEFKKDAHYEDSVYYRGMTSMLQAKYAEAITDFRAYQEMSEFGEHVAASMFREAVCLFGLNDVEKAEAAFTKFIDTYPNNPMVSEAYSMRGDIEAAKEASIDDPHTLDRALTDYRKGIDTATMPAQGSYAAFQAAKVYKLEFKWQEIIDLMNYYMDEFEEQADVAEAVFWIGQAQIELGEVDAAVTSYLDAVKRFGNDPSQNGVDKIILELMKVATYHLDDADRDGLALKIKLQLTNIDPAKEVLRLRLEIAQAMLEGDDVAAAFGAELLEGNFELVNATPLSLSLMCDAAVDTGNVQAMDELGTYFIMKFEDSDLVWHAYRAKTYKALAENNYKDVLWSIEEVQGLFGAEPHMGWAQILKADTRYKMGNFEEAEKEYNMCMGVAEWRGPIFAEAMFGMGRCKQALGKPEEAHSFYQRTYLLFKSYDDGKWAAMGYLAAADILIKMGREDEAVKTLEAMLNDDYTKDNPLADEVRQQLKKFGGQE